MSWDKNDYIPKNSMVLERRSRDAAYSMHAFLNDDYFAFGKSVKFDWTPNIEFVYESNSEKIIHGDSNGITSMMKWDDTGLHDLPPGYFYDWFINDLIKTADIIKNKCKTENGVTDPYSQDPSQEEISDKFLIVDVFPMGWITGNNKLSDILTKMIESRSEREITSLGECLNEDMILVEDLYEKIKRGLENGDYVELNQEQKISILPKLKGRWAEKNIQAISDKIDSPWYVKVNKGDELGIQVIIGEEDEEPDDWGIRYFPQELYDEINPIITLGEAIQGLEKYTEEDIIKTIKEYVIETLDEYEFDDEVIDIMINGSRKRYTAKENSDLDIVVFYDGNDKDYVLFNLFSEEPLYIDNIKVDINPINIKDNSIANYTKISNNYDNYIENI